MLALRREAVHGRVAVAVGHVDLPARRHGDIGRVIERCLERRPAPVAERQHHPTIRRQLEHLVLVTVAEIDVVIRADEDPVGVEETLAAPPAEEATVMIEDHDRRILPLIEIDAVPRVHGHVADEPQAPPRGHHAPGAHRLHQADATPIAFSATADADAHALYWFVDDAYVGQGAPAGSLFWQPRSAGSYRVRVVDDHGRSDERLLEVGLVQ